MDIKIHFDNEYHVKDTTDIGTIKILMLKGEKGDSGEGGNVDSALSPTSENPVQNKVIKAALDGKVNDVQISGSSIVSSGIANIPKASESNFGVAKVYAYGDPPIRMVRLENSGNGVFSVPMLDESGHIRLAVLTEATTSAKGAMSASDKSKLDGIEAEANKTVVDSALDATSENPVQNAVIKAALDAKANASDLDGKEDKMTEVEVIGDGAVTQALDAGKYYRFVGSLTSLTISLTSAPTGTLAHYHFDFETDATAPTLTLPSAVVMPDGFAVEANKRYEIDILNNYGAVMTWEI